jgi:hypothetical protein
VGYGYKRIERTPGDNGRIEVWIEDTGYAPIVDSLREKRLKWVDLLITNGCFDKLDRMKYEVQSDLKN